MLDATLATLADVVPATDAAEIASRIEACRASLAEGTDAAVLQAQVMPCLEAARAMAAQTRSRATEQRLQVTALVAMVRETVATLSGDQASLHESLAESAGRFERLSQADDLHRIQEQLFEEIAALKQISIERRQSWEKTVEDFGSRLTMLETQLDNTRREASLDPLTNVANRRSFERTCREWLAPNRPGFVMAMADVDDFKQINDKHGHAVGDRVLVAIADSLVRSLRGDDVVARLGGDEFAVIAVGLTLRQAESRFAVIARNVQAACREVVPEGVTPSISLGLAECSAGDTLESLQQRADAALYQAKKAGKGRVAANATPLIRDLRSGSRNPSTRS
jgi:diguanylate cyclase (GGDEF)-like protein